MCLFQGRNVRPKEGELLIQSHSESVRVRLPAESTQLSGTVPDFGGSGSLDFRPPWETAFQAPVSHLRNSHDTNLVLFKLMS